MIATAAESLNDAHRAVFDVARKAAVVLAGLEGTGPALTRSDIAASIGISLHDLSATDQFLVMLSLDAALDYRGWSEVPSEAAP